MRNQPGYYGRLGRVSTASPWSAANRSRITEPDPSDLFINLPD